VGKVQMRSEYPTQKVEKKPSKVKAKVTETVVTTGTIVRNAEQLVVASALLITTVFAYTQLTTVTNQVWYYMVLGSVIIVGLLAFSQLVKFLNRR
jgi:exo-beta-1,3-glucanase (GH17 family)